jgi:hypothetical protein
MAKENFFGLNTGGSTNSDENINPATGRPWDWGAVTRFSKDNQPSSEVRKAGWDRKRRNQELYRFLLGKTYVGKSEQFREQMQQYFGLSDEEMEGITNEAVIVLKQIGRAIELGDTQAAEILMQRAFGKPKDHLMLGDGETDRPIININVISPDQMQSDMIAENEMDVDFNNLKPNDNASDQPIIGGEGV